MGPRFNGVEDVWTFGKHLGKRLASMGPRFNGVEDTGWKNGRRDNAGRFNGATL